MATLGFPVCLEEISLGTRNRESPASLLDEVTDA
jgi:hypothetical protein